MTPKEQYEARKAERKRLAEDQSRSWHYKKQVEEMSMLDMMDRFVTAVEQIATALTSNTRGPGAAVPTQQRGSNDG